MKWAAAVTIGLAAAFGSLLMGPLWVPADGLFNPQFPDTLDLFFLVTALVPLFLVAGLIGLLFLRLGLASKRRGIATRMALGEQRSTLLRHATRTGSVVGAIAAGAGVLVGVIFAQFWFAESGGIAGGELSVTAITGRVAVFVIAVGVSTFVSFLAIRTMTRGTPDAVEAGAFPADAQTAARSPWRLGLARAWWVAYALALVVAAINRVVPLDNWSMLHLGDPGWLMVTKNLSLAVALLGTLCLVYLVTRWLAVRAVNALAALLRRSDPRGAHSLAADGLLRPSPAKVQVLSLSAIIALLVAASIAGVGHANAISAAGEESNPDSYLFSVSVLDEAPQPPGSVSTPLDADALAALTADPRVRVVPLSLLYADPFEYAAEGPDWRTEGTAQDLTLAIDVAASDAVAPNALREMGLASGVVLDGQNGVLDSYDYGSGGSTGVTEVMVDGQMTLTYRISAPQTFSGMDRDWATGVWGEAPVSGVELFLADGLPDRTSAADIAREYFPEGTAWTYESDIPYWEGVYGSVNLIMMAIGLGIAVVLIVSATATSVKLRRRDLATFAALGASPSALRTAPVWEAAALAASSSIAGALVGVATSVVTTNVFLLKPGAPTELTEILWHAWSDLFSVPWGWIVLAGVVTVGAAALAAAVFGSTMAGRSPVEELRTADKEGAPL